MASFNFLRPTKENLSTFYSDYLSKTSLTFNRNNGPIIYTNYPEPITQNGRYAALAENGYCVNQQEVSAGEEAMVFFSHRNETGQRLKYRVRIQNISNGSARVTRSNIGFSYGWNPAPTVEDYYRTSCTNINISRNTAAWLTPEYSIPTGQPFNGMVKIMTNQDIKITLYAYLNCNNFDGREKIYTFDDSAQFSGKGTGFFLTAHHGTIELSDLPYRYLTNTADAINHNENEITAINIAGREPYEKNSVAKKGVKPPMNNLANWCTQYYHTITLHNNTNKPKTVYGYIMGKNTPVVAHGSNIASYRLGGSDHTWKWCKIEIPKNEYYSFDWQTILASYGHGYIWHEWSLTNRM